MGWLWVSYRLTCSLLQPLAIRSGCLELVSNFGYPLKLSQGRGRRGLRISYPHNGASPHHSARGHSLTWLTIPQRLIRRGWQLPASTSAPAKSRAASTTPLSSGGGRRSARPSQTMKPPGAPALSAACWRKPASARRGPPDAAGAAPHSWPRQRPAVAIGAWRRGNPFGCGQTARLRRCCGWPGLRAP